MNRATIALNIKLVSDLRNYTEALRDIAVGELSKDEQSAKEKGWTDISDVEKMLGIANG